MRKEAKEAFEALGGEIIPFYDAKEADRCARRDGTWEEQPLVRIVEHPDEFASIEDLEGDTFNPDANPDVRPDRLAQEREAFIDRVNRDGAWGYVAEWRKGDKWIVADSIWGFVGGDFESSGHDADLMRAAVEASEAFHGRNEADVMSAG